MATKTFDVREIREQGFEILDEALKEGPVHITKGTEPAYVLVSEEDYAVFAANGENDMNEEEPFDERMRKSLEDIRVGRVSRGTAEDLLKEIGIRQWRISLSGPPTSGVQRSDSSENIAISPKSWMR